MKLTVKEYDPELIVKVGKADDNRQVIDLNLLSLKCFFNGKSLSNGSARGVNIAKFKKYSYEFDMDLYSNTRLVSSFLLTYAPSGRLTVFGALKEFFDLQFKLKRDIRDCSTVPNYANHLQKRIYSREIGRAHAISRLSFVNKFLDYTGDLQSKYNYQFKATKYIRGNRAYTRKELMLISHVAKEIFEVSGRLLVEHVRRAEHGHRIFQITNIVSTETFKLPQKDIEYDYQFRNPIYWFFHSSFVLFCIYTWGNESQITSLKCNDFSMNNEGAESDFIYKGRANKFIRLTIGNSHIDADRSGRGFLDKFLKNRKKLLEHLLKEGFTIDHDSLFFMVKQPSKEIRTFSPSLSVFRTHPIAKILDLHGEIFPQISSRKIRRTAEQIVDNELKQPIAIIEKAQHSWETYRRNYALGNEEEARAAMSSALSFLIDSAINEKSFREREKVAEDFGITLRNSVEVETQINGLGCIAPDNLTNIAKKHIFKQEKYGRNPKICADLSNCVNCENCAVIDDQNAIYQLLSFKWMIEYNKTVYVGSSKASSNYQDLVEKINFMLEFVDRKKLAKAKSKLHLNGVDEAWRE
ncbi:hypothetical protein ACFSJ3_15730 [Corallincola platygyrae]|uniref:Integrase n=1 Tax=Corallincola platygyrae TaxID=1193278 RepID=A0ABW4XQL5_9GAMM